MKTVRRRANSFNYKNLVGAFKNYRHLMGKGYSNRYITSPKVVYGLLKIFVLLSFMDLPWGDPRANP
jgi:hypothetical protein